MCIPHPAEFGWALRHLPAQKRKSAYIGFFQIPWLPELYCGAFRARALIGTLLKTSRPGTFSEEDLEGYRQAWSRPNALHSMLQWYRAIRKSRGKKAGPSRREEKVKVPTQLLWGARDAFFADELAERSVARCVRGRLERFSEGTHWIHHEEPIRVARLILDQISEAEAKS
jgi:pimeloyl-ACP methyl ester carboxylesterase